MIFCKSLRLPENTTSTPTKRNQPPALLRAAGGFYSLSLPLYSWLVAKLVLLYVVDCNSSAEPMQARADVAPQKPRLRRISRRFGVNMAHILCFNTEYFCAHAHRFRLYKTAFLAICTA
jgi:hypothetical protein